MYISSKFVKLFVLVALLIAAGTLWNIMYFVGFFSLFVLIIFLCIDILSVYNKNIDLKCERICSKRFSNGDENSITLKIKNNYNKPLNVNIIEELPFEFQNRDFSLKATLPAEEETTLSYNVTPKRRGEYTFYDTNIFLQSKFGLIEHRFVFNYTQSSKVYPSFAFIKNMELLSIENKMKEYGLKTIRKTGNSNEFDRIKEYIVGDDYRTINWRATARKHQLMCNAFSDEQAQQIYNIIDKGRGMQHAFSDMMLIDYAINCSLVLSYIAIQQRDKAGIITFEKKVDSFCVAANYSTQMTKIQEALYKEESSFIQSDYSSLYAFIKKNISKRSLLIFYSTFDTLISLQRQLPYLRKLASTHVVLVVFFIDKDLNDFIANKPTSTINYFEQTIAEKFCFEKKLIVNELRKYGIYTLLTSPEDLTANTINKYLELKARRTI